MNDVILPALRRGAAIVSDRYVYSSVAYFAHRGVPPAEVVALNAGIPEPDVAVFLDAPPGLLQERIRARDGALLKYEEQAEASLGSIRDAFLRMRSGLVVLDARLEPTRVSAELVALLAQRGMLAARDTAH